MADQRFKVENGLVVSGANNIFTDQVTVGGNTTIEGDLLLVEGNFTVLGTTTYTGAIYYDTDLIPLADNQRKLGNGPSNTFVAALGNTTIYQFLHPSANNKQLGNTTQRWDASITNLDASGILTLAGNVSVNSTALAVISNTSNKAVGINTAPISSAALYVVGNTNVNGSINIVNGGNLVVNGSITTNGTITTTSNTMTIGKMLTVTNRTTINSNTATEIDSFTRASGKFAKYVITADNSTAVPSLVHIIEMSLVHDNNGNVIVAKYGENFNTKLGLFDASANTTHVIVTYQANSSAGLGATGANTTSITTIRQQILN
jgi:hypothetical protein